MEAANNLAELNVLLTRPAGQSATLAQSVRELGGNVCELPLIEIDPVSDPAACELIKARIMDLDQYDAAIFVSTNAARLAMQWIDKYWPQLPAGLSAYAVGPATAEVLETFPWPVYCSDKGVTSEDLLALPGLCHINGQRIALFRGVGGRELIAETLRQRGARVDYIELYTRHTPDYTRNALMELLEANGVNAVVCTSAQILDVLLHALHNNSQALQRIPVIVPSERVRQHGVDAGLNIVINAGGAADDAIIKSLLAIAPAVR
jgi:uroporphyrinogen-III synthase